MKSPFLLLETPRTSHERANRYFVADLGRCSEMEASDLASRAAKSLRTASYLAVTHKVDQVLDGHKRSDADETLILVAPVSSIEDARLAAVQKAMQECLGEWEQLHSSASGTSKGLLIASVVLQRWEERVLAQLGAVSRAHDQGAQPAPPRRKGRKWLTCLVILALVTILGGIAGSMLWRAATGGNASTADEDSSLKKLRLLAGITETIPGDQQRELLIQLFKEFHPGDALPQADHLEKVLAASDTIKQHMQSADQPGVHIHQPDELRDFAQAAGERGTLTSAQTSEVIRAWQSAILMFARSPLIGHPEVRAEAARVAGDLQALALPTRLQGILTPADIQRWTLIEKFLFGKDQPLRKTLEELHVMHQLNVLDEWQSRLAVMRQIAASRIDCAETRLIKQCVTSLDQRPAEPR